ncbi:MAG: hypothetical protein F6K55_20310 [Moorea sp. SIO4A3]|nr:hypothetical protein [Moorena sp. SIO4A3]
MMARDCSPSRKTHHYGQREAVPTCGGFPHSLLPWFPRGFQGVDAGSAHRPMRHSRFASRQVRKQVPHKDPWAMTALNPDSLGALDP